MSGGTWLKCLSPLGKSSSSLDNVGLEVPGDQWRGMTSCKSQRCCTVRGRLTIGGLTDCGRGESKNWMLRLPVSKK